MNAGLLPHIQKKQELCPNLDKPLYNRFLLAKK